MSDYISKSALMKYLRDYKWEFALGSDFSKAIEMVDVQPTLDEKEIIRKPFERVLEKIDYLDTHFDNGDFATCRDSLVILKDVLQIIKEECGINE